MGNAIKRPAPVARPVATAAIAAAPAVAASPPITIRGPSTCDVNKVSLNQLKRDLEEKQTAVDTCDPSSRKERVFQAKKAELDAFVGAKETEFRKELAIFDGTVALASSIHESQAPLREHLAELKAKKEKLAKENEQLEFVIRSNRRRFMDGEPQEELPTVLGLKTSDDKVMFFFWSAFLLAAASVSFVLLSAYGDRMGIVGRRGKIAFIGILTSICYGIAYYFIYKFA
jgi:hypothetical protein